jgi:hypothetical protein
VNCHSTNRLGDHSDANTLSPRTGILTIGAQSFIVRQAGVATPRVIRAVTTSSARAISQLSTNTNRTAKGRLGIALALATGQKFAAGSVAMTVELRAQGNKNTIGFSLNFNTAQLANPQTAAGTAPVSIK